VDALNFAEERIDQADLTLAPLEMAVNCKFVRQRRHTRVRLQKPVIAFSVNLSQNCAWKSAPQPGRWSRHHRSHLPPYSRAAEMNIGLRNLQPPLCFAIMRQGILSKS